MLVLIVDINHLSNQSLYMRILCVVMHITWSFDDGSFNDCLFRVSVSTLHKSVTIRVFVCCNALYTVGPVMMAQAMAPYLTTRGKGSKERSSPSVIVNFSARVGSISDNRCVYVMRACVRHATAIESVSYSRQFQIRQCFELHLSCILCFRSPLCALI